MVKAKTEAQSLGVGLDTGTMFIVSARKSGDTIGTKRIRDTFLDLKPEHKRMLRLSKTSYIELDGNLLVIGDAALDCANLLNQEARRPMAGGVLNAGEVDAQQVIALMMKEVLGDPRKSGEKCCYSVPATALDVKGSDITYHRMVLGKILSELGYTAEPINEALAIIFSECVQENFSGIGISYGSGMTNVCLAYNALSALEFSIGKCLSDDFPIVTPSGVRFINEISVGDLVLGADGRFVEVVSKTSNGYREKLVQLNVELMQAFPLQMTPDHRIFVKSGFNWEWTEASDIRPGDTVGIPIIKHDPASRKTHYFGSSSCKKLELSKSRNLGRFFGSFLGDGKSCVPSKGGYVELSLNKDDVDLVEKYLPVLGLFGNSCVKFDRSKPGVALVHVQSKVLATHMDSFYGEDGEKVFPIPIFDIPDQMAIGILEGLFDTDGHVSGGKTCFTTTSRSIVMTIHHLLNRFCLRHRIAKRDPRVGGVNHLGKLIVGRKNVYEIQISDFVSNEMFRILLLKEGHFSRGPRPDFMEYQVSDTCEIPYGRDVWDVTIASDYHSFSSPCAVVHNCGDWIDTGAAQSVGSTKTKICALKESGIDINDPKDREQEAIGFFVESLIDYSLKGIVEHFHRVKKEILVPKPIPIVV
ncbi:hypothetical protein LCGC14_1949780, partial [marine sediment metagenome]